MNKRKIFPLSNQLVGRTYAKLRISSLNRLLVISIKHFLILFLKMQLNIDLEVRFMTNKEMPKLWRKRQAFGNIDQKCLYITSQHLYTAFIIYCIGIPNYANCKHV